MTNLPECSGCFFDERDHSCRSAGEFDRIKLARVYLDYQSDESTLDDDERFWSVECFMKLAEVAPELCLDAVVTCLVLLTVTPRQAGVLAAGPLEDIIAEHGAQLIDRIETLARRSPRFRYLLTGVWSQGNDASPIWARVVKAQATRPLMDEGGPLPPIDDWLSAQT